MSDKERLEAALRAAGCFDDSDRTVAGEAYVRPWWFGVGNGIERQLAGERQTGVFYG
ncbi:hypothetical protein GS506_12865 [Rhodococcus hoagii]|nr:hypothetical protein [Prescottella equi]